MPASTLQVRKALASTPFYRMGIILIICIFFQCIFLITAAQLTIADFSSCIPEGKMFYVCLFVQSTKALHNDENSHSDEKSEVS